MHALLLAAAPAAPSMAALKEARVASTASTAALASHALAAVATSVAGFGLAPACEFSHSNAAVAEAEAATTAELV